MAIEIGGIKLDRIHRVESLEKADFIRHRIPGMEGNVVQNIGRASVRLKIEGIFYGPNATESLESLRTIYKERKPVDFLAEIVGQAYFAQVILEQLDIQQSAQEPNQYSFRLKLAEFVPPPEPVLDTGLDFTDVDTSILDEATDFMETIELPDLLSAPEFKDPTQALAGILDGVESILGSFDNQMEGDINQLFIGET